MVSKEILLRISSLLVLAFGAEWLTGRSFYPSLLVLACVADEHVTLDVQLEDGSEASGGLPFA